MTKYKLWKGATVTCAMFCHSGKMKSMMEKSTQFTVNEAYEAPLDLRTLSDEEIRAYTVNLLGEEVAHLSQGEVTKKISAIFSELAVRDIEPFELLFSVLPDSVSGEDIRSGHSSWAKVYHALFDISRTDAYKEHKPLYDLTRELENVIDQNLDMVGPVALWNIAGDVMWRRDVPSNVKDNLMSGMTQALAFSDMEPYEEELLKNLDFERPEDYTKVAHMLEALKRFWSWSHDGYAEDRVPNFYIHALEHIKATPETNYLLSVRAQELLSMFKEGEDIVMEARDVLPFELSKGVYASVQGSKGLCVVPQEHNIELQRASEAFIDFEKKIAPSPVSIDEAVTSGSRWVEQPLSSREMLERKRLFTSVHSFATVPIDDMLGDLGNMDLKKRQELLFDYEYLVSRPIREMIQHEFAIELKDLSIREQFYFLNYLKRITVSDADTMKTFTSTYGVDGMRTFLSLERGDESLGDGIIAFGQHADVAAEVFRYYGELLDGAEHAETLVKEVSDCEAGVCNMLAGQVRENILNRAQKDLEKAVRAQHRDAVVDQLENYIASAKEYVALLQEVGAGNIEKVLSSDLAPGDKEQMRELLRKNYAHMYPRRENEVFRDAILSSLEKGFSQDDTVFRILRDGEKIVSFNRFDTVRDIGGREISYFGSFNTDPAYSGVGSVMLEETIKERLKDGRPMMAHCDPTQPITKKYIEDGFVATNCYDVAGKPSFEIWRSQDIQAFSLTKQKTIEELRAIHNGKDVVVREERDGETYPEFGENMVLTRFFTDEGKTYVVFERLPESLRESFVLNREKREKDAA